MVLLTMTVAMPGHKHQCAPGHCENPTTPLNPFKNHCDGHLSKPGQSWQRQPVLWNRFLGDEIHSV